MIIRKAGPGDMSSVVALAEACELDYPGMTHDRFWLAEEGGVPAGICGLKTHHDCLELCALGVREDFRGRGLGRALVETLLRETRETIFLATIIPKFFEPFGFSRTETFPLSMRKGGHWCTGCDPSRCNVMERLMTFESDGFKAVDLENKPVFDEFIRSAPSEACEIGFANIFIWRSMERPRWAVIEDHLCVLCQPPGELPYFLPPIGKGDTGKAVEACFQIIPRLSRVPEAFMEAHCRGFLSEPDRDNFDYVYRSEDLILLKGRKYDGKRNHIKKIERNPSWRYSPLAADGLDECRRLFMAWAMEKKESGEEIGSETEAISEALAGFCPLALTGGVIEIDGRIAAFSLGEKLSEDTAVIHVEIAEPGRPGLPQLINREFVRNAWPDFPFINREQDAGIPGLRQAKLSYHPHHLVRKFTVTPRKP